MAFIACPLPGQPVQGHCVGWMIRSWRAVPGSPGAPDHQSSQHARRAPRCPADHPGACPRPYARRHDAGSR